MLKWTTLGAVMAHDDEGEEYTECSRRNGEEVDGNDIDKVIVEECSAGVRWWLAILDTVFAYSRFAHNVTQQCEFGLNARDAAAGILARHAADQPANLGLGIRSADFSRSGFPSPEQPEAFAVPSDHGVWLHEEQGGTPVRPDARQDRPEDPITPPQAWSLGLPSQSSELLVKRELLQGNFARSHRITRMDSARARIRCISKSPSASHDGLETITGPWNASHRNSFIGRVYEIFVRDRYATSP